MIKIYTLKKLVKFSSEQIILFGLLENNNSLNIEPHNYNFKNESRYDSPSYRKSYDDKNWVIFNRSTGKILKSINYNPAKFDSML